MNRVLLLMLINIILLPIFIYSNDIDIEKEKSKIIPYYNFGFKQNFLFDIYNNPDYIKDYGFNYLNIKNELYFRMSVPINFYTFYFRVYDLFVTDFMPVLNDPKQVVAQDIVYNSSLFSIGNKIKIMKALSVYAELEFGLNVPVYPYISLYLNPILFMEGNYFFGFFWELEQTFPIDIYLDEFSNKKVTISNYVKTGYEFFRFYGQKIVKPGLILDNTINVYLPFSSDISLVSEYTFDDLLKVGGYLKFEYFLISSFFIFENFGSFSYSIINSMNIGINTGICFSNSFFNISFEYTFRYDLIPQNVYKISNRLEFYLKFYY